MRCWRTNIFSNPGKSLLPNFRSWLTRSVCRVSETLAELILVFQSGYLNGHIINSLHVGKTSLLTPETRDRLPLRRHQFPVLIFALCVSSDFLVVKKQITDVWATFQANLQLLEIVDFGISTVGSSCAVKASNIPAITSLSPIIRSRCPGLRFSNASLVGANRV